MLSVHRHVPIAIQSIFLDEMAHALLHNRTKDAEEKTPEISRSTEEVQAESISYAVCAYYGIATGDNSFGYIASWSKDKTLPELRESLEVISKTADGLINDIDRHYAEILKEREAELIAAEPAMAMERLYAVDDRYLHVQRTDTGVDYTIYDKVSMKGIDGGQLDMEISTLAESALEICNSHGIGQNAPLQVADIGILDELQAAQDEAIAIEPPVQENPEPEMDIPPDPAISVEARNAYGYTDDGMLPLTKERAMELFERDVPVYLLYGDNTEAMAFEQTEILNHDGIFGIDRADWEAVKEQFPVITENRWQKAFQQNPSDSYCIYQLRRDPELAELRFMNSQYLREHGLEPAFDHYEAVYSGALSSDGSTETRLDDLYMKFNTAHPQDFTGHSLSVSDIVAQQKQQAIKDAFSEWIWRDPDRRQELVTRYNELFNSNRPREYDGSHITFSGMNPEIHLREHQLNAVAHILYGGNTLLAHEVGAGKTFEMVAAAMESKRLGLCHKPMFVVPNHLTEQWASEFLRLYPSANILAATKKDFEPKNRKKFCARIATGDYDAIIIGHSQFERIPVSMERQERLLREQIEEVTEGIEELKNSRAERFTIKSMERTKKGLETKLKKLLESGRKDDVVTFEELGVDRLYVDEAHAFKNLFLYTKMRNVAGLSTTDAQKSSDP